MLSACMSLQLGLPEAVSVRHTIDLSRQMLTRVVSDLTGVIEREEISLAHACVSCAIREDIVPTLERLARSGRWRGVVACLPVAAEAIQVCRVVCWSPRNAPHVAVAAVVTALDAATVVDDLLGDDSLDSRGIATADDDRRSVAEVAGAMVEYADLVCITGEPDPDELALVRALARPGVPVFTDPSALDAAALVAGSRHHEAVEAWVSKVRRGDLPPLGPGAAWRLDLRSDRSFHPIRFQDEFTNLGGGPRRSRGCFWVPTRPDAVCVWDGAGGQASIGSRRSWNGRPPLTRITVVGLDDGAAEIAKAFHRCLLTDEELVTVGQSWNQPWDGLEPWLGPITQAA